MNVIDLCKLCQLRENFFGCIISCPRGIIMSLEEVSRGKCSMGICPQGNMCLWDTFIRGIYPGAMYLCHPANIHFHQIFITVTTIIRNNPYNQ